MFGISGEHLVILGIILLFFGPRRLPELGNTLGKAMKNFKDALSGVEEAKFRHLEEEKRAEHLAQAARPVEATPAAPSNPAFLNPDLPKETGDTGSGNSTPTA